MGAIAPIRYQNTKNNKSFEVFALLRRSWAKTRK